jgi:hypothetical protein
MMGRRRLAVAALVTFTAILVGHAADAPADDTLRMRYSPGHKVIIKPARSPRPGETPPAPLRVTYRVRPGANVDLGWTGISHGQAWPSGQAITFDVRCPGGGEPCYVSSGARGDLFGPPVPLSSGGIPVCVVNRLREAVSGRLDGSGCGNLALALDASVILAQDVAQPCPVCSGDHRARDGRKDGRCKGGENDGAACDAEGESVSFGSTSSDCRPRGSAIGTLPIDIGQLTTGPLVWLADEPCVDGRSPAKCFCPGQTQANACSNGYCALLKCIKGPLDGQCIGAPFRSCKADSGTADCEDRFPGSGSCEMRPRTCFTERMLANGICDKKTPTFVGRFCTPATAAPALNTTAGLPGPARLLLPLERVDTPGPSKAATKPAKH